MHPTNDPLGEPKRVSWIKHRSASYVPRGYGITAARWIIQITEIYIYRNACIFVPRTFCFSPMEVLGSSSSNREKGRLESRSLNLKCFLERRILVFQRIFFRTRKEWELSLSLRRIIWLDLLVFVFVFHRIFEYSFGIVWERKRIVSGQRRGMTRGTNELEWTRRFDDNIKVNWLRIEKVKRENGVWKGKCFRGKDKLLSRNDFFFPLGEVRSRGHEDLGNSISERFPTVIAISHRAAEPFRSFRRETKSPEINTFPQRTSLWKLLTRSNYFSTGDSHFLNLTLNKITLVPSGSIIRVN